jgi:hypothetical protein
MVRDEEGSRALEFLQGGTKDNETVTAHFFPGANLSLAQATFVSQGFGFR